MPVGVRPTNLYTWQLPLFQFTMVLLFISYRTRSSTLFVFTVVHVSEWLNVYAQFYVKKLATTLCMYVAQPRMESFPEGGGGGGGGGERSQTDTKHPALLPRCSRCCHGGIHVD